MSRKFFAVLSLFAVALLLPVIGSAQISFVPGIPRTVANGPSFIGADDFNNDGILDAVVSSTVRQRVTVLFGSPDSNFSSVVEIPVGRLLRDLTTGDFNGDRLPDIAVADTFQGGIFLVYGITGAAFSTPQFFAGQPRGPFDIARGRFDSGATLDLATANNSANTFTVYRNEGGTRGLLSLGNFPTGRGPRSMIVANLNGDVFDDIILLDTGTRGTDEVSVYLNQGNGTFQGIVPQRFVVGVTAGAMTSADFNGDGKLDLAVLNSGGAGLNNFTISILLGDVNPMFNVLPPVVFSCPARLNGIPIVCTPQDIKAADFDSDTRIDLAVSFSTRATDSSAATSGFVNAYSGRGNGTFDFGTQVIVGLGPRRIIAADVTGDAVPDVVVTEFTSNQVRVLRSKTPDPKKNGDACVVGRQCESNSCVDGVCCATATCQAPQRCDVFPNPGTCKDPAPNGTECSAGDQCASRFCVDGYCCGSRSCPTGNFCNTGMCAPPAGNGTPCNMPEQCSSGFCTDGVCCSDERCAVNAACNITGSEGVCTTRLPPGSPCTDERQCCTSTTDITQCDPAFCTDGFCCEEECAANETCGAFGTEGICVPAPTRTTTPRPTPTVTQTPTPAGPGSRCTNGSNCTTGNCVDGVCCNNPSCPSGQTCSNPSNPGNCTPRNPNGQSCTGNQDCASGFCRPDGVCADPPTATPTLSPTPVPPGGSCATTAQCQGGFFCNTTEGVCCNQQTCPVGQSCRIASNPGFCVLQTPTPTPRRSVGESCVNDVECDTGFCTDNICCTSDTCTRPDRCDILGFQGDCVPPLPEGFNCDKNADCESNFCDRVSGVCSPPPSPTPTLFIPQPPTPTPNVQLFTNRSGGGCAIDHRQSNGSNAFLLLAALPLAVWLRRRLAPQLAPGLVANRRQ